MRVSGRFIGPLGLSPPLHLGRTPGVLHPRVWRFLPFCGGRRRSGGWASASAAGESCPFGPSRRMNRFEIRGDVAQEDGGVRMRFLASVNLLRKALDDRLWLIRLHRDALRDVEGRRLCRIWEQVFCDIVCLVSLAALCDLVLIADAVSDAAAGWGSLCRLKAAPPPPPPALVAASTTSRCSE